MKKIIISLLFSFSVILFCALVYTSSPYRMLRPYSLFGKNLTDKKESIINKYNGRTAVLVHGSDEIESFYIDQIPVTIGDYKACTRKGDCKTQHYKDIYAQFWSNDIYRIFPVTFVTWMEARNYCNVSGGDLPTEQQWELSAGKDLGYDYPWGNNLPSIAKSNIDGFYQWLTPAGWLPEGASPFGLLDMTGNIREWVLDEIYEDNDNKLLKGGGENDTFSDGRIEEHFDHGPTSSGFNRGFRCVYPIE